jgi:hypothetical protein
LLKYARAAKIKAALKIISLRGAKGAEKNMQIGRLNFLIDHDFASSGRSAAPAERGRENWFFV